MMIHWIFWENSHFKKTCLENPFLGFEGADSGSSCSRTWKESESNTDLGGWCSFKCITCGIDVVLWRRQIVTILNSCFCQTRRRTIWLFPSDISCELPKTGKLSRTDKWMSNTAKGCSDPHILIRDELARKSPPVLSNTIFVQINLLLGETSIQSLIRNFDVRFERNWWDCLTYSPPSVKRAQLKRGRSPLSRQWSTMTQDQMHTERFHSNNIGIFFNASSTHISI